MNDNSTHTRETRAQPRVHTHSADMGSADASPTCWYKKNCWYTLTICPSDEYQFFNRVDRLKKAEGKLYETIHASLNAYGYYILWPELSEPHGALKPGHKGPRFHYHGQFMLKSNKGVRGYLTYGLPLQLTLGMIEVDTIDDQLKWTQYCTKQQYVMRMTPLCNLRTIIEQQQAQVRPGDEEEAKEESLTSPRTHSPESDSGHSSEAPGRPARSLPLCHLLLHLEESERLMDEF